ncbi:MAG: nuclear transport factor 2 family protein [Mucilaginibacter sp.]|jgi:ketosteroid isomerase-like protein|uniref:nuclear transport factor 2 family protein n=1 Tax=Mucilaginibacter sp. TaxID=1882438 RepID=UPI003561EF88
MELPKLVARFVQTQNNQDIRAYVECFTESAIVYDEGKTHTGREEIRQWIDEANAKYQSSMKPLKYEEDGSKGTLTAKVSGTFPGSPIVLEFHLETKDGLIDSLKVTG